MINNQVNITHEINVGILSRSSSLPVPINITNSSPLYTINQVIAGVFADLYAAIAVINQQRNLGSYGSFVDETLARYDLLPRQAGTFGTGLLFCQNDSMTDITITFGDLFTISGHEVYSTQTIACPAATTISFSYQSSNLGQGNMYATGTEAIKNNAITDVIFTVNISLDGSGEETDAQCLKRIQIFESGKPQIANLTFYYELMTQVPNCSDAFICNTETSVNIFVFSGYRNIEFLLAQPIVTDPPTPQLFLNLTPLGADSAMVGLCRSALVNNLRITEEGNIVLPQLYKIEETITVKVRLFDGFTLAYKFPDGIDTIADKIKKSVREIILSTPIYASPVYYFTGTDFKPSIALSDITDNITNEFGKDGNIFKIIKSVVISSSATDNPDLLTLPPVIPNSTAPQGIYYDIDYNNIIVINLAT